MSKCIRIIVKMFEKETSNKKIWIFSDQNDPTYVKFNIIFTDNFEDRNIQLEKNS